MSTKTKKPKLNVRLLRRIQKQILKEPAQFFMQGWTTMDPESVGVGEIPNCGTAACIGGWAVALSRGHNPSHYLGRDIYNIASKIVGISTVDPNPNDMDVCSPAEALFCTTQWPRKFYTRWGLAGTPLARAKVAVARIEHLIKTGK